MIREAKLSELFQIMEMHVALKNESPNYKDLEYAPEQHFQFIKWLFDDEDGLILVNDEEGTITGFVLAGLTKYFFSNEKFAQEYTVYVSPAYRKGRTGLRLIRAMEKWAEDKGVKEVKIGTTVGLQSERYIAFLESIGYERLGALVAKRIG